MIDEDGDAWLVEFRGSCTAGWVDEDKAGTVEGGLQGLAKITSILS